MSDDVFSPSEISTLVMIVAMLSGCLWQCERQNVRAMLSRIGQAVFLDAAIDGEAFQLHLHKARMSLSHFLALSLSLISALSLILTLLIDYASGCKHPERRMWYSDLILFAVLVFCTRVYAVEPSCKSAWATNLVVLLVVVIHSIIANPVDLLASGPLRLAIQVCAWVSLLDFRFIALWSAVTAAMQIVVLLRWPPRDVSPGAFFAGEMSSLAATMLATALARGTIQSNLQKHAEVTALTHEHTAAKRMLSVLCDAQVVLGPDLRILSHCSGLSNLLITGIGGLQSLIGASFVDYMLPADQSRFHDFISTAVKMVEAVGDWQEGASQISQLFQKKSGTPASLPVTICDSAGLTVAVELYHIILPDSSGMRTHLIGITELDSSRSQYGSMSESEGGSSFSRWSKGSGAGSSEDRGDRRNVRTLRDLQDSSGGPRSLLQLGSAVGSAAGSAAQEDSMSETQSVGSSDGSSCSDSSVTSAAGLLNKWFNCPEFQAMEFVVDPFCNELSLREVHLFIRHGKDVEDRNVPALGDWLWPDCKRKVRDFVQGRLNEVLTGRNVSNKSLSSITFKLPSRSQKFGLVANHVGIGFSEVQPDDEDSESVADAADAGDEPEQPDVPDIPDMTARIQCSAFMLKRMQASKPQLLKEMEQKAKAKEDLVRSSSIDGGGHSGHRSAPSQTSMTSSSSEEFTRLAPIQEGRRRTSGLRGRRPTKA